MGQPSRREIAMLDKIGDLEDKLSSGKTATTENWNPCVRSFRGRLPPLVIQIFKLGYMYRNGTQSIATIDSAFDTALNSALKNLLKLKGSKNMRATGSTDWKGQKNSSSSARFTRSKEQPP